MLPLGLMIQRLQQWLLAAEKYLFERHGEKILSQNLSLLFSLFTVEKTNLNKFPISSGYTAQRSLAMLEHNTNLASFQNQFVQPVWWAVTRAVTDGGWGGGGIGFLEAIRITSKLSKEPYPSSYNESLDSHDWQRYIRCFHFTGNSRGPRMVSFCWSYLASCFANCKHSVKC